MGDDNSVARDHPSEDRRAFLLKMGAVGFATPAIASFDATGVLATRQVTAADSGTPTTKVASQPPGGTTTLPDGTTTTSTTSPDGTTTSTTTAGTTTTTSTTTSTTTTSTTLVFPTTTIAPP